MIVLLLVAAIIFQLAWSTICLLRNLSIARRIGLPYVIIPQTEGVFWFVVMLSPVGLALARWLPVRFGDLLCFNTAGLRWRAAGRMHEKYGPVITLVTPGAVHVVVADPEVCLEIARNYKGYIKPVEQYGEAQVISGM